MVHRLKLWLLGGVLFLALLPAGSVLAHGPLLRGLEIDRSGSTSADVGQVPGKWVWYTVGLLPGPFHISATISQCALPSARTCGMSVYLMRGHRALQSASLGCTFQGRCSGNLNLDYRIHHPGAFYVLVQGAGAAHVQYSMRFRGNIYPLRCGKKYC